jgi:hypothetical protein
LSRSRTATPNIANSSRSKYRSASTHEAVGAGVVVVSGSSGRGRRERPHGNNEETVKSYGASAAEYVEKPASMAASVVREIEAVVDALGRIGRILGIGSDGGRDAKPWPAVRGRRPLRERPE